MDSDLDKPENPWLTLLDLLLHPQLLLQGGIEYFMAWIFTRGWPRLLLIYSLPLFLVLACLSLVGVGLSLSQRALSERYDEWITKEIPDALSQLSDGAASDQAAGHPSDNSSDPAAAGSDKSTSYRDSASSEQDQADQAREQQLVDRFGELLLRRALQLQNSSSRITYLVAAQLAKRERLGQARQMMRRIAPTDAAGFAPAHAWLAATQLSSGEALTEESRKVLNNDLSNAIKWNNCPAGLIAIYAEMAQAQGNKAEAMDLLERAGSKDDSLMSQLRLAEMALRDGQSGRFQRVAEAIRAEIDPLIKSDKATAREYSALANLLLMRQETKEAQEICRQGLQREPKNPQLLRLFSESLRIEYLLSARVENGKTSVDLSLLDAALKADPTNPGVGLEIARLQSIGQDTSPELQAALEQQLAAGQASALTHILLANRLLIKNELSAAEPHLEIALRQAPNSPTVMNNLALVLARTKPQEMSRALQLATDACQAAPTSGQFRDTLGEVRELSGDKLGAIESYEAAVGLEPNILSARQRLVALYQELGMKDMASAQQRELDRLQQPTPAAPPPSDPVGSSSP